MRNLLRYLRIAFSLLCGIVCLALTALWVRSYWYWDELYNPISNTHLIVVESASGRAMVDFTQSSPGAPWIWHLSLPLNGRYWEGPMDFWEDANRDTGIAGFALYANPWHTNYRAPLWFFILVFAAIGAAPWLKWSKRFSLRTLLILITILAAVLGLGVYTAKNVSIQQLTPPPFDGLSPYGLKAIQ
jgi:hypothetical protein